MNAPPGRWALLPAAAVVGGANAVRRAAYRRGWLPVHRIGAPVVSVGALRAGGSGKTPATALVAEELQGLGMRVGVVHSGYAGAARRRLLRVDPDHPRAGYYYGDEAALLARWLPDAIVVRGADKVAAAAHAAASGADVVVLDDGFQHRRLARDLEIVLLDEHGPRPWTSCMPAGDARETGGALSAADLRWYHRRDGAAPARARCATVISSRLVARSLFDPASGDSRDVGWLAGRRVSLLAGVARPGAFTRLVRRQQAEVVDTVFVRDHGKLRQRHLRRLRRGRPDAILCTEKDLARGGPLAGSGVWVLRCAVEITGGGELLEQALRTVACCA